MSLSNEQIVLRIFIIAGLLLIYFTPIIVGRRKRNASALFILNLFGGWTVVGWIAALVWACTED